MMRLLLVMLAGGLGSGARWLVIVWAQKTFGESFPWGVFAVNVIGSFLIACIAGVAATQLSPVWRLTLATGFLGGFTTYSAFNQDTLQLIQKKLYGTAALYSIGTFAVCLLAGFLGLAMIAKCFPKLGAE